MSKRFYLLTCMMLLSAAGFAAESRYFCAVSDEIYYIADSDALFGLELPHKRGACINSTVAQATGSRRQPAPHFALPTLKKGNFGSFLRGQCGACAVLSSRQFRSESACTTRIHMAIGDANRKHGSLALEFIQPIAALPRDYASNFGAHSPP